MVGQLALEVIQHRRGKKKRSECLFQFEFWLDHDGVAEMNALTEDDDKCQHVVQGQHGDVDLIWPAEGLL